MAYNKIPIDEITFDQIPFDSPVDVLGISKDGQFLAIGFLPGDKYPAALILWNLVLNKEEAIVEKGEEDNDPVYVENLCFGADQCLYYLKNYSVIVKYDILTKQKTEILEDRDCAYFSLDQQAQKMIIGSNRVKVLTLATSEVIWEMTDYEAGQEVLSEDIVKTIEKEKDDNISVEIHGKRLRIKDPYLESKVYVPHQSTPAFASFTNQKNVIAIAGFNQAKAIFYNIKSNIIERTLAYAPLQVRSMEFSCDFRYLLVWGWVPGSIYVWDLLENKRLLTDRNFVKDAKGYSSVVLHPDNHWLLTSGLGFGFDNLLQDDTIRPARIGKGTVRDIVFTPNGRKVIKGGNDMNVYIIDISKML